MQWGPRIIFDYAKSGLNILWNVFSWGKIKHRAEYVTCDGPRIIYCKAFWPTQVNVEQLTEEAQYEYYYGSTDPESQQSEVGSPEYLEMYHEESGLPYCDLIVKNGYIEPVIEERVRLRQTIIGGEEEEEQEK